MSDTPDKTRHQLRAGVGFQDSVDVTNSVQIDYKANPWWRARYSCWEVKGPVAEDYKGLGQKILDELRQSCRESSGDVSIWPYMVGKSVKKAKPVLVIASEDAKAREEAKAAIERSKVLADYPYMKLWAVRYLPTGPVNPVAMEDQAPPEPLSSASLFEVFFNPLDRLRAVGMPVYIQHDTMIRQATANAIYNGVDYGYMTAAHAFTKPADLHSVDSALDTFQFPFDSDSDADSNSDMADNEDMEMMTSYSATSPEVTESELSSLLSPRTSGTRSESPKDLAAPFNIEHSKSLSQASEVDRTRNASMHSAQPTTIAKLELLGKVTTTFTLHDCAIVIVTNAAVISFLIKLRKAEGDKDNAIVASPARRTKVTACTSRGHVNGSLADLPLYMRFVTTCSYQVVYKFTYEGIIKMGDCGSLVVDASTKEVYGYIIADSQHLCVAFVMAAKPVLDTVQKVGNWRLISPQDRELRSDPESTKRSSALDDWQDLVRWDDGLLEDQTINEGIDIGASPDHHETVNSKDDVLGPDRLQYRRNSFSATSVLGASFSTTSTPLNIPEDWWRSNPPSYNTPSTSLSTGTEGLEYLESFDALENISSPGWEVLHDPSHGKQDGASDRRPRSIFNPYVAGSPHAFSALDVAASRAIAGVGAWEDHVIYPIHNSGIIPENAIAVPDIGSGTESSHNISSAFSQASRTGQPSRRQSRSSRVATTLPESIISPTDQSPIHMHETNSGAQQRSGYNPTWPLSNSRKFGLFFSHSNTKNGPLPSLTSSLNVKARRGRTKALTAEQRRVAAVMREMGACSNCKRRKEKCDPGIPCQSCLQHYKSRLVHRPCRNRLLSDLSDVFLAERLNWHQCTRPIGSFHVSDHYEIQQDNTVTIPLIFGFGSALDLPVHPVRLYDSKALYHDHIIYSWPPSSSSKNTHVHRILPAVITKEANLNLPERLDNHLGVLVSANNFRSFPLFISPLRILREVYVFYMSLSQRTAHAHLIRQALKLLVLIHASGDLAILPGPIIEQLLGSPSSRGSNPTPCLIRSQLGQIMPPLARRLIKEVLSMLERMLLDREPQEWPVALATILILLMSVEAVQYSSAKLPYRHDYSSEASIKKSEANAEVDGGVKGLLAYYKACFGHHHSLMLSEEPGSEIHIATRQKTSSDAEIFIEAVRESIKRARAGNYLMNKAHSERQGDDDLGFFFDRHIARFLI